MVRYLSRQAMTWLDTVLVVLLVQTLCLAFTAARAADEPQGGDEIARQAKVYSSRGAAVPGGYVTGRTLRHYRECLPSGFDKALHALGPSGRWLDVGAGEGQAILDYQTLQPAGGKASAVALSIEDRRTERWHQLAASLEGQRIRYVHGKRVRDYSVEELGTFDMITDVFGGFSYTDDLSAMMEKVLALLEPNGSFYTLVQSVRLDDGKHDPDTWYLTEIKDSAGRDVSVCSWLKSIGCVQVSCDSRSTWDTPTELIQVRKICRDVSVPRLDLMKYEAGAPPGRTFLIKR